MTFNQELTLPASRSCPTCGLQLQPYAQVCPRDGTRLAQPLQVDPAFEKYEFIAGIGAGGMGVIYKARHRALNKFVAIKTLHSHLAGPDVMSRFSIEGKAASLLMHQNIVGVHDFGFTQSGQPYMIMDFVDGKTMSELLQTFVHHTAKRIDIGTVVHLPAACLLGAHIDGTTDRFSCFRQILCTVDSIIHKFSYAKIHNLNVVFTPFV